MGNKSWTTGHGRGHGPPAGATGQQETCGSLTHPSGSQSSAQRCCFLDHSLVSVPGIIDYKWEKAVLLVVIAKNEVIFQVHFSH